jgi:NDP-sugar pyrophosphorylase family protein
MRAVILAGGRGTRLAPYTTVIPKPLLPVGDKPILEIICRQLAAAGFTHLTLSLGYMSVYFRTFLAQHRSLQRLLKIDFVEEEEPTGTAGSLASVPDLEGTFLVMNGDILTNLDYSALVKSHQDSGAVLTIAAHQKRVKIDLGILETTASGQVTGYIEKPTLHYPVSMGIYVYDSSVLDHIEKGEYLDFPSLVLKLIDAGKVVNAWSNDATWLDLGRHEDLLEATQLFGTGRYDFLPREAA